MAYADLDTIQNPTAANYPLATWGAQINDNFDAMWDQLHDGWVSWSPTYAGFSAGAGGTAQVYRRIGHTVHFQIQVNFGSGFAFTTTPTFTLPVTPDSAYVTEGYGLALDASTSEWWGLRWVATKASSTCVILNTHTSPYTAVGGSAPFTVAASDQWILRGSYNAASATAGSLSS